MNRRRLFLVASLLVASAVFPGSAGDVKALRAEILLFSGRPDPVFIVDDPRTVNDILSALKRLPADRMFRGDTVAPSRLGYKGVLVESASPAIMESESFLVYHRDVEIDRMDDGAAAQFRFDGSAALENLLLKIAERQGVIDRRLLGSIKAARP